MVEVLIKYFQALFPRSNLIGVQKVAGGVGRRLTEEMLEVLNGSFTEDEVTLALKQTQRQKH